MQKRNLSMRCIMNLKKQLVKIAGHRILALKPRREGKISDGEDRSTGRRYSALPEEKDDYMEIILKSQQLLKQQLTDGYQRLIAPAIEREIRNELTEKAEDGAIQVFGKNLEQLLMQPPIVGQHSTGLGSGISYRL